MASPPIRFEQQFSRMKSFISETQAGTARVLIMVDFWPILQSVLKIPAFESHVEEYAALLIDQCSERHIRDLNPADLEVVGRTLSDIGTQSSRLSATRDIKDLVHIVDIIRAEKLFYAGDVETGLAVLHRQWNSHSPSDDMAGFSIPNDVDELDALRLVCEFGAERDDSAFRQAQTLLDEWEGFREQTFDDRVNCLFVEKKPHRKLGPGYMRELIGRVEYCGAKAESHEITFEHQIRSPDDPFVEVTYDALAAVRRLLAGPGFSRQKQERYIHAHFRIHESEHVFTGDSIGLASAMIVFEQLQKNEITRQEKGLAHCAAFTGAVDAGGNVLAVNERSLAAKIERAFFSPVRFLVIPEQNESAADRILADLKSKYPRRRLQVMAAGRLEDVVRDRNIIREEKVCAGRYIMRQANRYGRLAKIQVPLLLILIYILMCVTYPKAWIGFDWNPDSVQLNEARDKMLVFNRESQLLWSRDLQCPPITGLYSETYDLDGDGRNEVAYVTYTKENIPCSTSAMLTVCDDDGKALFTHNGVNIGEYPGDSSGTQYYWAKPLHIFQSTDGPVIVTNFCKIYPARAHIKIWSSDGKLLGWYINSGHVYDIAADDVNGDGEKEILGAGINNRYRGSCFFVLPVKGSYGVSPPYENPDVDLSHVKRGNQLQYIHFPSSDLVQADSGFYGAGARIAILPGRQVRVDAMLGSASFDWRSFYLDSTQQVYKVIPSDGFWSHRQKFVEGGYLPAIDMDSFCRHELDGIRYWNGNGWVRRDQLQNAR